MINLLTNKTGWQFAVIKGDSHAALWCEEQGRLDYDRSVEDVVKLLKPGDAVVDAGAFIGDYTVRMAKAVGETGSVVAFEPNLEAYVCLSVNCRDCPKVWIEHCALSDIETTKSVFQESNAGASHLINARNYGQIIRTRTLDSFNLARCDFIKMDIEGFEVFALRGAMETIKKFRPKMFIELNDSALSRYGFAKDDILKPLLESGYRMEFIDPKHNLSYPQLDVLLLPK